MFKMKQALVAACVAAFAVFGVFAVEPDAYYEWLGSQANAAQSINTEYVFTNQPRVVAVMMKMNEADCDQAGTPSAFFNINYVKTSIYYRYGSGSANLSNAKAFPTVVGNWVECVWTTNLVHDGVCYGTVNNPPSFKNNTQQFWLFKGRTGSYVRFKSVDMYDGDVLVRSYRPAMINGLVGLWDSVTERLFVNQGTGSFECGPLFSDPHKLTVAGAPENYGEVSPAYGPHKEVAAGESIEVSAPSEPITIGGLTVQCEGWKTYAWDAAQQAWTNATSGTETSFTYVHPDPAEEMKLEWQWGSVGVDTAVSGDGRVDCTRDSGDFVLTAVPGEGSRFVCWYGWDDLPVAERTNATVRLSTQLARPRITAYFARTSGEKSAKTWTNGTGSFLWTDADNWNPAGVPTFDDAVTVGGRAMIHEFAVAGSLAVVSGGAVYLGGEPDSASSAASVVASYADKAKARGLWVAGDVSCAGQIALGGRTPANAISLITNLQLRVEGDFTVSGSGKLAAYAASDPAAAVRGDFARLYAGATVVRIGGAFELKDTATLYPTCDELTGASVKFESATFLLDEGARVSAISRGWHWFQRGNYGGPSGYYAHTTRLYNTFATGIGLNAQIGSGHGGLGGGANGTFGLTYGYAYAPFLPGAPAGGDSNYNTSYDATTGLLRGGGCFWLRTMGEAVVNGKIDVSARNAAWDAASGGSVWLAVGELTAGENASITAQGANKGSSGGANCAGGGGRVSLAIGLSDVQLDALAAGEVPESVIASDSISAIAVNIFGGTMSSGRAGDGTATTVLAKDESGVTITVASSIPILVTGTDPAYGGWPMKDKEEHAFSAPAYGNHPENATWRYECLGYVVSNATTEVASGKTNAFTFTPSGEDVTVTWLWGVREFGAKLETSEGGHVNINGSLGDEQGMVWTKEGAARVLDAVPDAGWEFLHWAGAMVEDGHESTRLTLDPSEQRAIRAVFRAATEPTDYTWNGGTGTWDDATQWTPANIPSGKDNVTITAGTCTIDDFAAAKSLTVSGGTLKTSPTSASGVHNRARVNVHGDLAVTGEGKFTFGATSGGNTVWNGLEVAGNLTLDDTAEFLFSAGKRATPYTIKTGSGFVNVGGDFTLNGQSVFRPNCSGQNAGTPVVTVGGRFAVAAEAKVDADERGFGMFSDVSPNTGVGDHGDLAAGHGGRGQDGASDAAGNGGATYDYLYAPLWPGQQNRESGSAALVRGGGVVRVKARGICVDGTVTANGGVCSGGAASGGTIWLAARSFTFGDGAVLSAAGVTPSDASYGASGGGRIALGVWLDDYQYDALIADGDALPVKTRDITDEFVAANPGLTVNVASGDRAAAVAACQGTFRVVAGPRHGIVIIVR